ncbi:uncharacterized protein LOC119954791 [Scyliorhinus canicula]|uniref:uncharacterized protein LOC119954791 n=1 Tax=Scyliorhinus canicula TaxID=7830 RepID=UPI0018F3DD8C|nr:uncharacterized protein LOC119954791 [Scyliorhinus canicula]
MDITITHENTTHQAHDRPKTPSIVLNIPYAVSIKGELTTISCFVSSHYSCNRMLLHRNGEVMRTASAWSDVNYHSADFRFETTTSAIYTCRCETQVSGKWLISEHSERINITALDNPRRPTISLNPLENTFVNGEIVTITCSVDFHSTVYRFYLYVADREINSYTEGNSHFATFQIQPIITADYTCVCWVKVFDQWKYSAESDKISVTVIDRPPKPSIRLNESESIFLKGESITITCEAGLQQSPSQFNLFQGRDRHSVLRSSRIGYHNVVSFRLAAGKTEDYWCAYQIAQNGRRIASENSTNVQVPVIDPPITPKLSLNQNFTTILKGELLLLTCEAPPRDWDTTFFLYKLNNSFTPAAHRTVKGRYSVTYNITGALNPGVDHYRCMYNTRVSGRLLNSAQSDPIILTVIDHPLKPICVLETKGHTSENEQNITFGCTAPNSYSAVKFYFYINSQTQFNIPQENAGKNGASISLTAPRLQNRTDFYTCRYEFEVAGRSIESETCTPQILLRSDGINIYILIALGSTILLFLLITISICSVVIMKKGNRPIVVNKCDELYVSSGQSVNAEEDKRNAPPAYSLIDWSLSTVPENVRLFTFAIVFHHRHSQDNSKMYGAKRAHDQSHLSIRETHNSGS